MENDSSAFDNMNARSREVFQRLVEGYIANGDPVGSKTITQAMSQKVSPATIRNVMQDLEQMGLLDSPHTSAGRIPTQLGLRMFVDGLLEVSNVEANDRQTLDDTLGSNSQELPTILDRIGSALSGVTQGASLVHRVKRRLPCAKQLTF